MKPSDVAIAILIPLIWGLGFGLAKAGLGHFPPIFLIACRYALSALVLVWFATPPPRALLKRIALVSVLATTVTYSFIYTGLKGVDASTAGIIVEIEIPMAAIMAALLLKERLGWRRIGGMVLAFTGVLFIMGEPRVQENIHYVLILFAGTVCWSLSQVLIRSLGQVGGFTLITWMAIFATPQLFIASYLIEGPQWDALANAGWQGWGVLLYLGFIMNALGYAMWYHLLGRHPVNVVMPYQLLVPVATVTTGVLILGETMTWLIAIGGVIVIAGVAVITIERPTRAPSAPPAATS
ncbi:MAG: EamA family transporter [Alphaproteobacteria bacterium]